MKYFCNSTILGKIKNIVKQKNFILSYKNEKITLVSMIEVYSNFSLNVLSFNAHKFPAVILWLRANVNMSKEKLMLK